MKPRLLLARLCDLCHYSLLEINALGRLKVLFQRPLYFKIVWGSMPPDPISNSSLRNSSLPPPPNKSNLPTALHYQVTIERKMKRIAYKFCPEVLIKVFADTYLNLMLKTPKLLQVHCFQQNGLCRAVVIPFGRSLYLQHFTYRKIPKISLYFSKALFGGLFWRGLYSEGLIYGRKFAFQNRLG